MSATTSTIQQQLALWWGLLWVGALPAFAQMERIDSTEWDGVYTIVEVMPRFPGCEDSNEPSHVKKACADMKLLTYFYHQLRIPIGYRENGGCCLAAVSFVVNKDGTVSDFKVLRECFGLEMEIIRLLHAMNELPERWTPGYHQGKPVAVRYNLPMRIKL